MYSLRSGSGTTGGAGGQGSEPGGGGAGALFDHAQVRRQLATGLRVACLRRHFRGLRDLLRLGEGGFWTLRPGGLRATRTAASAPWQLSRPRLRIGLLRLSDALLLGLRSAGFCPQLRRAAWRRVLLLLLRGLGRHLFRHSSVQTMPRPFSPTSAKIEVHGIHQKCGRATEAQRARDGLVTDVQVLDRHRMFQADLQHELGLLLEPRGTRTASSRGSMCRRPWTALSGRGRRPSSWGRRVGAAHSFASIAPTRPEGQSLRPEPATRFRLIVPGPSNRPSAPFRGSILLLVQSPIQPGPRRGAAAPAPRVAAPRADAERSQHGATSRPRRPRSRPAPPNRSAAPTIRAARSQREPSSSAESRATG